MIIKDGEEEHENCPAAAYTHLWGHFASDGWYTTIQEDFVAGEFVWTGFDYIGEPTNWNGVGSGAVGTSVSYTHLDVYKRQCFWWENGSTGPF